MDGNTKKLRERWQQRSEVAFERMFGGKSQEELVTLTEREDMAVAIGRELAAFLLEEHVARDEAAQPAEPVTACCPKCGWAGTPAVEKNEELPQRNVVTRAGEIPVRRQRFRCAKCRVIFFPLDVKLRLGTEGYSPKVLAKAARQASKSASFAEASDDLRELAEVEISPTHLQRISERIGREWAATRDAEVEQFRESKLKRTYSEAPRGAAAVMLDGGRVQTRADDSERGVSEASWRESKVACCLTLATKAAAKDPHPEPPAKFLEPTTVARLASEVKRRSQPATTRDEKSGRAAAQRKKKRKKSPRRNRTRRPTRVRTVVATMADSETFGWQVAAEVHCRGLDRAKRKACVGDGQKYNWSIHEMHLLPLGFIAILDFVHLLAYLYEAAQALHGSDAARGWKTYVAWLRLAWSGKVDTLLAQLRAAAEDLAEHGSPERKRTLDETLTYVTNNRERMDYPEYRRLGLPISSAPVESTIKQINRRLKGSEKFWLSDGAEAMLQLRAAQLSDDGRWAANWQRPRPHRAAGAHRLAQAA